MDSCHSESVPFALERIVHALGLQDDRFPGLEAEDHIGQDEPTAMPADAGDAAHTATRAAQGKEVM